MLWVGSSEAPPFDTGNVWYVTWIVFFFFFLRNVDPAGMDFERRWTASQRRGQHADDQQLVNGNPTRGPDDRYSAVVGYIRAG